MREARLDAGRMLALNVAIDSLSNWIEGAKIIDAAVSDKSNRGDTHREIKIKGHYRIGESEPIRFEFTTQMGNRHAGYGWLMAFAHLGVWNDPRRPQIPNVLQCALPR